MTNNFSKENVLGSDGFGTIYKGKLFNGTKIAIKRMEVQILSERRLKQFETEIAVLTKVRRTAIYWHYSEMRGFCFMNSFLRGLLVDIFLIGRNRD